MDESPVTLITGGSSGIGAATARTLLGQGHRVTVTGRDQTRLDAFVDSCDDTSRLLALRSDTSVNAEVEAAVATTVDRFGRITNVVANAGYATHDGIGDGDPEGWRDMVLTNVLGPALLIQAAIPHLRKSHGRVVLMGSVAGFVHTAGNIYGATKFAVTGLAENTRLLLAPDKIGVTLVAPGPVDTDFFAPAGGPPADQDLVSAEELAAIIAFALGQPAGVDINTLVVRPTGSPR